MIGDGGSPGRRTSPTAAESGAATSSCAARPVFEVTGSPSLLVLSGELDVASASLLAAMLEPLSSTGGVIRLDVARLTFIDSSGVRVLCTAAQRLGPHGHLIVFRPTRAVRRTIELTGLDSLLEIVDHRPGIAGSAR